MAQRDLFYNLDTTTPEKLGEKSVVDPFTDDHTRRTPMDFA